MHTTEWDREELRRALKEIMDLADLSQAELGRIAGRDRTTANRWITGNIRPAFEAASAIAAAIEYRAPELAERLLVAAGYRVPSHASASRTSSPQPSPDQDLAAKLVVEELRQAAREEEKSIGDILVERGLASPEELTVSEKRRADRLVKEILASNLPEDTKNILLLNHAGHIRHADRKEGLLGKPEQK